MAKTKTKFLLPELSVFFPAYNEEKNIDQTVEKAVKVLKTIVPKWEIVIVNDGSQDHTAEHAAKLAQKYPNVKVITHSPNKGYGAAFKSGLFGTSLDWVTFTDADGQFDFSDIKKLIAKQKATGYQVILGYRIKRSDPLKRIIIAFLLKIWNFLWFGFKGVKDVDCAFKLFHRSVLEKVKPLRTDSAITTTELLIKIQRLGYRWAEVGVNHFPRAAGSQTGSNLKVMSRAARDSLNLWRALH